MLESTGAARAARHSSVAISLAVLFGIGALAIGGPAAAQQASADAGPAATGKAVDGAKLEEVIVTGSHIARGNYDADSPIVTVPADQLTRASEPTIDNLLTQLPQFTGNGGAGSVDSGQNATTAGTGIAALDLRNLGENRNLVLLDGRRMQPASNAFAVDVNSLPISIIDSVEVITGGASAVYGSDAIAGVVNFKLKHHFQGLELDVRGGESGYGDYGNVDVSLLGGANVADGRGNLTIALDYTDRDATLQRDRPFFQRAMQAGTGTWEFQFLGYPYWEPAFGPPPSGAVLGAAVGAPGPVSPFSVIGFNTDDTLFTRDNPVYDYHSGLYPQNPLYTHGATGIVYTGNYNNFATSPLQRYSGYAHFDFEVTEGITAYAQTLFTQYTVETRAMPPVAGLYWGVFVPNDAEHPVPAAFETVLQSRGGGAAGNAPWFLERILDGGPGAPYFPDVRNTTEQFQSIVGLKGALGGDWSWDVYGSHGDARINSLWLNGQVDYAKYAQLVEAPSYGQGLTSPNTGELLCTSGVSPFMSQADISADCWRYMTARTQNVTDQQQDDIEANVTGGVLQMPAGRLKMAFGADYRRNTYDASIDPLLQPSTALSAIGPCPPCASTIGFNSVSNAGAIHVWELYSEALVPILRDLPMVRSLDVDLGYRHSDYSQSGGVNAFKADLNWNVAGGLRIRGGYERAVRAPNPIELFGARASVPSFNAQDPCVSVPTTGLPPLAYGNFSSNPNQAKVQALCAAMIPGSTVADFQQRYVGSGTAVILGTAQGNPELEPETANTATVGVAYASSPGRFPLGSRLSASLDYYDIDLKGAINVLTNTQTYALCFDANGTSNPTYSASNPYCEAIVRTPFALGGSNATVTNIYENSGGIRTRGVDLQADWSLPAGPGVFAVDVLFNYLIGFEQAIVSGAPFVDYAGSIDASGVGYFRTRTLVTTSYAVGPVDFGVRWKHLPGAEDVTCVETGGAGCAPPTGSYDLLHLFASVALGSHFRVMAGIDNLLDTQPPVVGGVPGNTNLGEYDLVGRSFWAGFKAQF